MRLQEDTPMRLQKGTNETAGSRAISAGVGQHTEVGLVERVENPSTPSLAVSM